MDIIKETISNFEKDYDIANWKRDWLEKKLKQAIAKEICNKHRGKEEYCVFCQVIRNLGINKDESLGLE